MPLFGGKPDIEKMKAKRDIKGLIKALDGEVRMDAYEALVKIGTPAIEPLIAALSDEQLRSKRRWNVALALGEIGDAQAVEPLIAALKDSDEYCRAAALALGDIGDSRAVEPLIAALKDSDEYMCRAAASALGEIGDVRAVEPLIAVLKIPNGDMRRAAAEALGKIGDARAVKPLTTALRDSNESVREAASAALNKINDAQAVEPLAVTSVQTGKIETISEDVLRDRIQKATIGTRDAMYSADRATAIAAARNALENATPEQRKAIEANLQGVRLDDSGRSEEALGLFDQALRYFPENSEIWGNKGLALNHLGRYQQALDCFDRSIELQIDQGNTAELHIDLGNKADTLLTMKHFEDAAWYFGQAVQLQPDNVPSLFGLGQALEGQGRYAEAVTYYERVLALKPRAADVQRKLEEVRRKLE